MYSLTQTIAWARTYIQYSPLTAGTGSEPATSIATMIRNSILGSPLAWPWNRAETTQAITSANQDYVMNVIDFGFLEKATLSDDQGNSWELKYPLNADPLGPVVAGSASGQARPNAISILTLIPFTSIKVRLLPAPQANYTLTLTYQKAAPPFVGGDVISAVAAAGGQGTYTGVFTVGAYPVGSLVTITGMGNSANNGTFVVVSANATTLVVTNAGAANETHAGVSTNPFWSLIPDTYMDVFNNLFLSEAFASVDEPQRAQLYRTRGVAALLARSEGLTEAQKNAFMQQWHITDRDNASVMPRLQQGIQGRGI